MLPTYSQRRVCLHWSFNLFLDEDSETLEKSDDSLTRTFIQGLYRKGGYEKTERGEGLLKNQDQ